MVILHIAAINNKMTAGVNVAVPQHVRAQAKRNQVALLNIRNEKIDTIDNQIYYEEEFNIEQLPVPFCSPDIVVFHNTYYLEYVKIARNLKKNNIPYVIVPHGTLTKVAQNKKWLKKKFANIVFFNSFFDNASEIQFLSRAEMCSSIRYNKGFVATNGVFVSKEKYETKNINPIKLVYIGRTEVYIKGLDIMLKAVNSIISFFKNNNLHLKIYGPDYKNSHSLLNELIVKYNLGEYITLYDAVVGEDKEKALLDADVFIQTSRSEGLPMGLLEALSYGVPCIVTEGTGMGNIIKEYNAGWCAETNISSVANAIKTAILEKNLWVQKSEMAKKLISENYTWEKTVEDALTKYDEIVSMREK